MATSSIGIDTTKLLMVWAMPISDRVAVLFTMVFINLPVLLKYVSEYITKTDTFHLIIPLDCLEHLLNDPVYKFPQVRHIDVYYDDIGDLASIQRRFNLKCERLQFCSVCDLPGRLERIMFDNALALSDPIDRNTRNAIISSIKDRISAKRWMTSASRYQVLKKFASTVLHGFPIKNINVIDPYFICSSCQLLFQELYQLECSHRKCIVCLNIRKSCTTCSAVISRDKAWFDQDFQILMQNLTTSCISCEWIGPLEAYQEHFKENHYQLLTCLVRNLQVDNDNVHQSDLIDTNQRNFLDNLSLLSSDLSITSLNGACIWKLSGIGAMINNGTAGQRKSIYSAPFYSFLNGYKICLRICLNGDAKARDTHISLFFVLMRGNYDGNLQWPFKFKVTFTLLNHLSSNHNHSNSFWSDITSICFQRPRSNMNIAYGISEFVPIDLFEKNQNEYVKNDTMFIRVEVDFLTERPTLPLIAGAGELLNEEEYVDINYDNLPHLLRDFDTL